MEEGRGGRWWEGRGGAHKADVDGDWEREGEEGVDE